MATCMHCESGSINMLTEEGDIVPDNCPVCNGTGIVPDGRTSTRYIANAFSTKMIEDELAVVIIKALTTEEACEEACEAVSRVGHKDTAEVFSSVLKTAVKFSRKCMSLRPGDRLLVGEVNDADGKPCRFPEGACTLPEGFTIRWRLIKVGEQYEESYCGNCGARMDKWDQLYDAFGHARCPECCSSDVYPAS